MPVESVIDYCSEPTIQSKKAVASAWNEQAKLLVEAIVEEAEKIEVLPANKKEVARLEKPPFYGDLVIQPKIILSSFILSF